VEEDKKQVGMGKEEVIRVAVVAAMFSPTCCCCCISYRLVVHVLVDVECEREASVGMAAAADEDNFLTTCCCCGRCRGGEKGRCGYKRGGWFNGGSSGRRLRWRCFYRLVAVVVDAVEENKAGMGMSVEDAIMVAAVAENFDGDVFYELVVIVIVFPWAINCHSDDDDEQHILDFVISLSNGCFRSSSKNIVQKSHQKQNNKSRTHT